MVDFVKRTSMNLFFSYEWSIEKLKYSFENATKKFWQHWKIRNQENVYGIPKTVKRSGI